MDSMITEVGASGEEIYNIVSKIEPVLVNESRSNCIIACLSIAMTLMNPDISPEALHEGVKGCSEWICLFLSETPKQMLDPKMVN